MKRRRRQWADRASAILRLAFLVFALAIIGPAIAGAQLHTFRVPKALAMVDTTFPGSSSYIPDKVYDRWWHEIADCEGLTLPPLYSSVRWYQINALVFADSVTASADETAGKPVSWLAAGSYLLELQIFVALPYRYTEEIIKHEMLHWLLFWNGISMGGHPAPYYGRCGVRERYSPPAT